MKHSGNSGQYVGGILCYERNNSDNSGWYVGGILRYEINNSVNSGRYVGGIYIMRDITVIKVAGL